MKTSSCAKAPRFHLLAAALVLVALATRPDAARSDDFHYKSLLVGNRAAAMAGAYTALSDDPSGLYYNPAGIVYTNGANISASSNAFQYATTEYKNAIGSSKWTRSSSTLLPNFFGAVQPLGNVTVGLSYAVPDSVKENLDQDFRNLSSLGLDTYVLNLNQLDDTYLFGPSVAWGSGKFSAGLTLYGYYRHWEITMNQWIKEKDTTNSGGVVTQQGVQYQTNLYYEDTESGVRPIFGMIYSPTDHLSLGLSAARTFVLKSKATKQVSNIWEGSANDDVSSIALVSTKEKREYPWTVTLGGAWYPDPSLILTLDATLYSITSNDEFPSAEPTWNVAAGCEYYANRQWALRGGLYTNNSNTLKLKKGYVGQDPHIDEVGASFSTSYFSKSSSIELGLSWAHGTGRDQVISGDTAIQNVTTDSVTLFLSANYFF